MSLGLSAFAQFPTRSSHKVLDNRLKWWIPKLILPNQASFIAGRQISNNIIITQEVLHSMHYKRGSTGWMAIKVDLEKAYDRLRWDLIEETLFDVGLPDKFVRAVMLCVTTCSMRVVWNGARSEKFTPSREIRQGHPLSLYLFVLCMERLLQVISQQVQEKKWLPITFWEEVACLFPTYFLQMIWYCLVPQPLPRFA